MSEPFEKWTVLPHGELTKVDDDMMTVTGELHMPLGDFPRRMTVVKLARGGLVVFSPIALNETEMAKLLAFGTPAYLVVPSARHRMDVKPWKGRFPSIRVSAPRGAREKVAELVAVDDVEPDFGDPQVRFVTVPGTDEHEAALHVESPSGLTIVLNELVFNVPNRPGLGGWLFEKMGMTGNEPHIPGVIKLREVKDPKALGEQLLRWSTENVKRIIVSHGSIIETDPSGVLARLGQELTT